MSMQPFDFSIHNTVESKQGNGATRDFDFTTIPALTQTDIQIIIYNKTDKTETIIDYADFDFIETASKIGFHITLHTNIAIPSTSEIVIAKIVRAVKNEIIFPDGSTPSPFEQSVGYQALALSIATLKEKADRGYSFSVSDLLENIHSLDMPKIDTAMEQFNISMRKREDGKYEFYFSSSEEVGGDDVKDVKEIDDDYTLRPLDGIVRYKAGSPAGKKVILYQHTNLQEDYVREIEIRNESDNGLDIEYKSSVIDTLPKLSIGIYKIDENGDYTVIS